ncbi:MAG: YcjX family protein [Lentisphaeria bacterium]|nr:YcjX family protein [Lentisphaeria bacterium]
MFNWTGNHKIGILGTSNCGKTVFLTSLLWHLDAHDRDKFDSPQITDCEIISDKDKEFNYIKNKNIFAQFKKWPDKTTDYAKVTCKYKREDCFLTRNVTFIDIPGERMSDIQIWQSKNYAEWSDTLFKYWDNEPSLKNIVQTFCDKLEKIELKEETVIRLYKDLLKAFILNYSPITPSTYYLAENGTMLSEEDIEGNNYYNKAIWEYGDFAPLPQKFRTGKLTKIFENRYKNYKKKVIKPLFDEINSCDNFIVCVDIFDILNAGRQALYKCEYEIKTFFDKVKPNKFMSLYNHIGKNPPRIAFVATKSDLVTGENLDKLNTLLDKLVLRCKSKDIKSKSFTCSAFRSTRIDERGTVIGMCDDGNNYEVVAKLPNEWPLNWSSEQYCFWTVSPGDYNNAPPAQTNLDKIFHFITEDQDK